MSFFPSHIAMIYHFLWAYNRVIGFYIHTCQKMRYKAAFSPCYILDPETYNWLMFDDDYRKRLDVEQYITERQLAKDQSMTIDEKLDEDDDYRTVFNRKMSGAMTMKEVEETVDLGELIIQVGGRKAPAMVSVYEIPPLVCFCSHMNCTNCEGCFRD